MEVSYRSTDEIANKAKDSGYAYTREEIDKGLFAPDKWFDHTFAHDSHNKTVARTKKILNRGEEELGLSPQRRQFAGGCVPGSTNKSEQGNSKIWRNGKTGNRDDIKNETSRWKHTKDNDKRDNRQRSHVSHTEELPEWMESKISVNDVIELKGFDGHNTETSTQKPKEIPLTVPKFDELQLLQEIQRSDSSSSSSQPASGGSRFISFFKRNQESQQPQSPLSFNTENVQKEASKSSNLNDLFGSNHAWPEMPVSAGVLASDIEKRMHAVDISDDSPSLLPELINTIRNPPDVHIKSKKPMNISLEHSKLEDDIIASLLPKHDVFIGKEKQQRKLFEEPKHAQHLNDYPSSHQQNDRQNMWDSKFSSDFLHKLQSDDDDLTEMIHGLNRTPDLSYYESSFPKNERERSISPPHQPPPPHMYADTSGPSRSSPAPPSMLPPPFGRMPNPFPNMPMSNNMSMPNNGMPPPMMRFPFYPFPMMNPQMGPNGVPLHPPSSSQNNSSAVTHGGNLPTSVLLRMKSQNSSNANSQRSPHSPDVVRRENNLSSPLISDMPQTSNHREGSVTNSDNESNSNGPSSSNMFPRNPNNFDPNMLYNMMIAQSMMNMQGMPPSMQGMPPFPPNMPPFHGHMPPMPPGMHVPFGSGVPPPFFPPGMQIPSERPNSISPKFEQQLRQEQPSIPESILRQLPSSARPLTVADLERNLLSKN
uniref:Uncharacterized protein n=1 Tax=Panagrolaimus superbus TaxID=310955 RepID=A0A914Y298_9BILA